MLTYINSEQARFRFYLKDEPNNDPLPVYKC